MKKVLNQKEQPTISIIVPVYKVEKYIHRCVKSILQQTYEKLEIILVDDGSPDNCGNICDDYEKQDSRIRVIHQDNQGISAARNTGLDVCSGEYIAFVDSDDYIMPDMYEKMIRSLCDNEADICVCQWQYEQVDGQQVVDVRKINLDICGKRKSVQFAEYLYKGSYENGVVVAAWNKLYKKCVFEKIRFIGKYLEDDRIHNEILSRNYEIFVMPEQMYVYCQNIDSLTNRTFRNENLMYLDILNERVRCFGDNDYIVENTKKMYCNIYIEYFYKASKAKIKMKDYKEFDFYVKNLWENSNVNIKFMIRMAIFRVVPNLYKIILDMKTRRTRE